MRNALLAVLTIWCVLPHPVPRAHGAPPCYVSQIVVVTRDARDDVIDRVVTTGIWRYAAATDARAERCTPADSGAFASLQQLLRARLDSSANAPSARRSYVDLRDTSIVVMRQTVAAIARAARQSGGAFHQVEVIAPPTASVVHGVVVDLGLLSADSVQASACAAQNDSLRRAGAPFHWAC